MPPVDQPADRPRVAGTASEDEASGFRDPSWQTAPIFPLDRGRRPSLDSIAADPLCDLVGIEAPVVLAPIGCAVTPLLAEGVEDGSKPESSEGATREKGLAAWLLRWECLRSFPARPAARTLDAVDLRMVVWPLLGEELAGREVTHRAAPPRATRHRPALHRGWRRRR